MLLEAFSLVSTVLLLMALGFFVLGSTPLLILKHEVPMDSRVVRQVFHYCYRVVTVFAIAASLAFALVGRAGPCAFLGGIALIALGMHHLMMTRMDVLRTTMHEGDRGAVSRFRKLHVTGIALNLAQLVALIWGLTQVTR